MLSRIPRTELPTYDVTDTPELVPLAALAAEGFGPWGSAYTKSPRDVIDALAQQLEAEVVIDRIGRRCVPEDTAARLLAARAEAEQRMRESQQRREAELPAVAPPPRRRSPSAKVDGYGFEILEEADQCLARFTTDTLQRLAAEPWLRPFLDDGDTDLDGAEARYREAVDAARVRLHTRGVKVHRRIRPRDGVQTTAVEFVEERP